MKTKRVLFLLLTMVLVFSLAANSQEAPEGGTLVIANDAEVNSVLWYKIAAPEDYVQLLPLYESLLRVDKNGQPYPFLLESYSSNPEELTYTLKLKEGIKFHDDSELTAEVCKWNLEMYKEKGRKSASFFGNIESFEVTGDYTVVIHMSTWDSTIPQSLARESGYMFSKQAWEKHGEEYCKGHPVGTGPFKLKSWTRDVEKTYVKFTDYWQGEPLLDKIKYHVYSDPLVVEAALKSGDVHAYFSNDYELNYRMKQAGFNVETGTIPTIMPFIQYNSVNEDDPFYDIKVRQAVAHAIDQEALCEVIYRGFVEPTNQFAPSNSAYYSEEVEGYEYNPEKAKELLAEAGYPDGFETRLQVKNETTLVNCVTSIQAMLKEVGIDVNLDVIDSGDYVNALCGWDYGMFFHPTGLPSDIVNQANSMWTQGLSGIVLGLTSMKRPDDVHNAITSAVKAKTSKKAQEYMQKAQELMIDKYCLFWPVGVGYNVFIKSPELHDDGINEVQYQQSELWSAWLEK